MIPKIIVGFGHRSGVGKDTLAKFLDGQIRVQRPGVTVNRVSFAWKLKEICHDLYHWAGVQPPIHYENHREDRDLPLPLLGGITVVDLWVKMGTHAIRDQVFAGTWVEYVIQGSREEIDVVIIPDVRFPDEATRIRETGGILIRVDNLRVPHRTVGESVDDELVDWTDWNAIYDNDGDLRDLMAYAGVLADDVLRKLDE